MLLEHPRHAPAGRCLCCKCMTPSCAALQRLQHMPSPSAAFGLVLPAFQKWNSAAARWPHSMYNRAETCCCSRCKGLVQCRHHDDNWSGPLRATQAEHDHPLPADEDITHEVITTVDAPVNKCFKIWENRMNWLEWFDLLGQVSLRQKFMCPVAYQRLGALLVAMRELTPP